MQKHITFHKDKFVIIKKIQKTEQNEKSCDWLYEDSITGVFDVFIGLMGFGKI